MRRVVLDTSAVVRLYVPDGPLPDRMLSAIEDAARGEVLLLAPELLLAEVAQVLWKKEQRGHLTPSEAAEVLEAIVALPVNLVTHRELLPSAVELARRQGLTVYDALFLALAERHGAALVTADQALRDASEGHRLRAPAAPD